MPSPARARLRRRREEVDVPTPLRTRPAKSTQSTGDFAVAEGAGVEGIA